MREGVQLRRGIARAARTVAGIGNERSAAGAATDGGGVIEEMTRMLRVVLAQPRGFCAGVERAIEIVERALEKYGPPIYVRHEIVHNRRVVERRRAKGAHFLDGIGEAPRGP